MPARVLVLHFERLGERLHAAEEQLFETARLRGYEPLETLLVRAILDDELPLLERLRHSRSHFLEVERLREIVGRAGREAVQRRLRRRRLP